MKPWSIKYYDENGEVLDSWYAKELADTDICCEIEEGKYAFLVAEIEDPIWIRAWYGELSDYAEDYPDPEEDREAYEAYAYDSFFEFFSSDQYYYWNGDRISSISTELATTTKKWYYDPASWSLFSGQIDKHDRLIANILKAKPGTHDLDDIISERLDSEEEPNDVLNEIIDVIEDVNYSLREEFANFLYWNGDDLGINTWDWGIMHDFYPEEYPDEDYWDNPEDDEDEDEEDEDDDEGPWDEDIDDVMKDIGVF